MTRLSGNITVDSALDSSSSNPVENRVITDALQNINVSGNVVSKTENGLCPMLPDEETTTKYLRQDGVWAEPTGGGEVIIPVNPAVTPTTNGAIWIET